MRLRRQLPALQRHRRLRGWRLAAGKIHFFLWEVVERRFRHAKVFRQQRFRDVPDPVGDAEGAELGKIAVVEDQDEMAGLVAKALQHVAVAAGKVPDVARIEIVGLGKAVGIDDGGANAPLEHERPFGRGGVPVHLAHRAGLEPHRNPGNSLGDRQLRDGGFLAVAVADHLAGGFLQRELERRQILSRHRGIGDVVHEAGIAGDRRLRSGQRRHRGDGGGGGRNSRRCGSDMLVSLVGRKSSGGRPCGLPCRHGLVDLTGSCWRPGITSSLCSPLAAQPGPGEWPCRPSMFLPRSSHRSSSSRTVLI